MNRSKETLTVSNIIHTTTSWVCSWGCVMEVMNSVELSRTPISLELPPEFHALTYAWKGWAFVRFVKQGARTRYDCIKQGDDFSAHTPHLPAHTTHVPVSEAKRTKNQGKQNPTASRSLSSTHKTPIAKHAPDLTPRRGMMASASNMHLDTCMHLDAKKPKTPKNQAKHKPVKRTKIRVILLSNSTVSLYKWNLGRSP
jgi:hypothetical protein